MFNVHFYSDNIGLATKLANINPDYEELLTYGEGRILTRIREEF